MSLEPSVKSTYRFKKLYKELNKKYFKNSLPDLPVVFCTPEHFKKKKWGGKMTVAITEFHGKEPVLVALKKQKNNYYTDIKLAMLHEMVHIYTGEIDCSKEVFKKEIRRLAVEGAYDDVL